MQYPSLKVIGFRITDSNEDGFFKPFHINDKPFDAMIYNIIIRNEGRMFSPEGASVTFDSLHELVPLDPLTFTLPMILPGTFHYPNTNPNPNSTELTSLF